MTMSEQQTSSDSEYSSLEDEVPMRKLRPRPQEVQMWNMSPTCVPVELEKSVTAFLKKTNLERSDHAQPINCSKEILEKVFTNYVIVKNILSYLSWHDKLVCTKVSPLWDSAVMRLKKEQLAPVDFSINIRYARMNEDVELIQSGEFYNEPMVVFMFNNNTCDECPAAKCEQIIPSPCREPCNKRHSIVDYMYKKSGAPNGQFFGSKAQTLVYLPLQLSPTYDNALLRLLRNTHAFYFGLQIPSISGVEFLTVSLNDYTDQESVINDITKLSKSYTFKGVVVYLTQNYTLYTNQDDTVISNCLEHLGSLQPDAPFALGGCLVNDAYNSMDDMNKLFYCINEDRNFISGNQMSLGIFAVPKNIEEQPSFDVFSIVINHSEWSKEKIVAAIKEFAQSIPRYEHSVGLKLSCSGRYAKHEIEQSCFRSLFPRTPIIGCFGNGELGVNYPFRYKRSSDGKKRVKTDMQYDTVHSYSTVFMYIGWGKLVAPANVSSNE